MSHISEGMLHIWLDGAADDQDPAWRAVRLHFAGCDDCARRLEEARRLRDGASALLREADAPAPPAPSFSELEALAGRRAPAEAIAAPRTGRAKWSGWHRLSTPGRLAWAASLMLAAGAGWMGRQMAIEEGVFSEAVPTREAQRATTETPAAVSEQLDVQDRDAMAKTEEEPDLAIPRRQAAPAGARDAALADAAEDNAANVAAVDPGRANADESLEAAPEARAPAEASPELGAREEREARPEPAREVDVLAFRGRADDAATAAVCYRSAAEHALSLVRIGPGRTAGAVVDGRSFVGYWMGPAGPAGEVSLSLSDGVEVLAVSGDRTEQGLTVVIEPSGASGPEARVAADAGPVTLSTGTCEEPAAAP